MGKLSARYLLAVGFMAVDLRVWMDGGYLMATELHTVGTRLNAVLPDPSLPSVGLTGDTSDGCPVDLSGPGPAWASSQHLAARTGACTLLLLAGENISVLSAFIAGLLRSVSHGDWGASYMRSETTIDRAAWGFPFEASAPRRCFSPDMNVGAGA